MDDALAFMKDEHLKQRVKEFEDLFWDSIEKTSSQLYNFVIHERTAKGITSKKDFLPRVKEAYPDNSYHAVLFLMFDKIQEDFARSHDSDNNNNHNSNTDKDNENSSTATATVEDNSTSDSNSNSNSNSNSSSSESDGTRKIAITKDNNNNSSNNNSSGTTKKKTVVKVSPQEILINYLKKQMNSKSFESARTILGGIKFTE